MKEEQAEEIGKQIATDINLLDHTIYDIVERYTKLVDEIQATGSTDDLEMLVRNIQPIVYLYSSMCVVNLVLEAQMVDIGTNSLEQMINVNHVIMEQLNNRIQQKKVRKN